MVVVYQYFTADISSIFGIGTRRWCVSHQRYYNLNLGHLIHKRSHLSRVVPLGCLGDVVHEVELASGGLGHLPARRQGAVHIVIRAANVVALLSLVVQLQGLVRLENKNNQTFHHSWQFQLREGKKVRHHICVTFHRLCRVDCTSFKRMF